MSDLWKRKNIGIDPKLIYKSTGNDAPIIKYFWTIKPELKPYQDEEGKWHGLLISQANLLKDLTDFHLLHHVVSCGRGFGKTMICSAAALFLADEYSTKIGKPLNVLIVSSQKAMFENTTTYFRNRPDLAERLLVRSPIDLVPKDGAQFKDNLSRLIPAKATVGSVEGNRADVIILDETQDIEEEVIMKAAGCSKKDIIGMFVVIGTPIDKESRAKNRGLNWFIELVKNPKHIKGMPYHLTQHPSDVTGGWNSVDDWKAMWSKERFDAECLGIVTETKDKSYFGSSNVKKIFQDVPTDPIGGTNSVREVGIDCGFHHTDYALTEKLGPKRNTLFLKEWKDCSIEDIAPEIASLINQHNPIIVRIDSKSGSIANYRTEIKKYCYKRIESIDASKILEIVDDTGTKTNITIKDAVRGQMLRKVRENQIVISTRLKFSDLLLEQMLKYNIHHKEGDDLLDALMLSCYEPPKGSLGGNGRVSIMNHPIHMEKGQGWRKVGKYGI